MKTIEEVSKEYSGISEDKYSNTAHAFDKYDIQNAFEAGVDFAQRWISVEEELPTDNEKYLVKINGWGIGLHPFNEHYQCWDDEDGDDYFTDAKGGKITHWRKIELL